LPKTTGGSALSQQEESGGSAGASAQFLEETNFIGVIHKMGEDIHNLFDKGTPRFFEILF